MTAAPSVREYQKTPSPEKEKKEEEEVLDLTGPDLEYEPLKESFADELVAIEERMAGVDMNLPPFKVGDDGLMMEEVGDDGWMMEEGQDVLDLTGPDLEYEALQKSLADELVAMEERMAGVDMNLPPFKVGEDGKMMELVSQKVIRAAMKWPPHPSPLPDYTSMEALRSRTWITDEVELETFARSYQALQSAWDTQNDIIQQYRTKGYAYAYPRFPLP